MKILFVNGSPNRNGNTAALAKELLQGKDYESLNLTDYRINTYGQTLPGDQFDEVLARIKAADILVIGSPVYWHNICGSVSERCLTVFTVRFREAACAADSFSSSRAQHRRNGCWMREIIRWNASRVCTVLSMREWRRTRARQRNSQKKSEEE